MAQQFAAFVPQTDHRLETQVLFYGTPRFSQRLFFSGLKRTSKSSAQFVGDSYKDKFSFMFEFLFHTLKIDLD